MFWRASSPVDGDDEAWQFECWRWLLGHLGGVEAITRRSLILPTRENLEWPNLRGSALAAHVFARVSRCFDVNPADFDLVAQAESINPVLAPLQVVVGAPVDAAGTYSRAGNRMRISYNPALLANPMRLVATFAHEICHPLLFNIPEDPPGGPDMEEFATDLAVIYFGFGIISANTASNFVGYRDDATGTQGWSFNRLGYLSPAERGLALAIFLALLSKDTSAALPYLEAGASAYFRKAAKYVAANPDKIAALQREFP